MPRYVALLRAVNVGGNRLVKMSDLRDLYVARGLRDVVTYIQSGNIVFSSESSDSMALQSELEAAFATRFGFAGDTVVRDAAELAAIIARNPFAGQPDRAPEWLVVLFLADQPSPTAEADLRQSYAGPETFSVSGKEVFLYYPSGMGRSKLTNVLLERSLQTRGTARNWNTVLKLAAMLQ